MSCVHFKFSNTVENDKIKFDGLHISVADLKEAIIKQKNLKSSLYSLKIIDSQTKKEYSDSKEMLPRNTSVVVSRIPLAAAQRIHVPKSKFKDPTLPQSDPIVSKSAPLSGNMKETGGKMLTAEELRKTADLANANATEEEKVMAMMSQSGEGYDISQYVWAPRGAVSAAGLHSGLKKHPPPSSYICHRCGNTGHWIQLCPTNGDPTYNKYRYKRSIGIPSSEIVSVTENVPGAMLDRFGQLVVRAVDLKAAQEFKKKNKQPSKEAPKEVETPPELICGICKELMKDAVIIPCCGESYCYECIQDYLCENEFVCPACKKEGVSPDNLAPNKALRKSAKNFQMKAAEDKSVAVASTTGFVKKTPITITTPQQLAANQVKNKVHPVLVASDYKPVSSEAKVEVKKEVVTAPEVSKISVEATPSSLPPSPAPEQAKAAESAEVKVPPPAAADAFAVKQDMLSVRMAGEQKPKSRSGSPASVASPAVAGLGVQGSPSGSDLSMKAELLADKLGMKQQSSLTSATAVLPGMLPGVPLTASGLLRSQTLFPQMLNVPSSMLPGQASLVMTQNQSGLSTAAAVAAAAAAAKFAMSGATSSDPTKLDRLAADLLLERAMSKKRATPSPPPLPLSQGEFYRQQKLLKRLAKGAGGRQGSSGSSSSFSSGSFSRSSSAVSSLSSSYSRSPSRSRSPYPNRNRENSHHTTRRRHKRDHPHERSREKRGEKRARGRDESRERRIKSRKEARSWREKEKEQSKHRHSKRKRYDSPSMESPDREVRPKRSRRSRSRSPPTKKVPLEEVGDVIGITSPGAAANTPPSEPGSPVSGYLPASLVVVGEEGRSPSLQRRHKHKRKSKKKHKHHRRASEQDMEASEGWRREEEEEGGEATPLPPEAVAGSVSTETMLDETASTTEDAALVPVGESSAAGDVGSKEMQVAATEALGVEEKVRKEGMEEEEVGMDDMEKEAGKEGVEEEEEVGIEGVEEVEKEGAATRPEPGVIAEVTEPASEVEDKVLGDVVSESGEEMGPSSEVLKTAAAAAVTSPVKEEEEGLEEESVEIAVHAEDVGLLDSALLGDFTTTTTGQSSKEKEDKTKVKVTPPLTREDLPAILDHLEPLDDWRSLGLELRVPGRKLTHIQQKYPVESLERVVLFWLEEGPKENCSWRYLADALRKIDRRSIANVIIKKYLAGLGILTSKTGKEEGEISDSEEERESTNNLPDLRETLNSSQNEPDLRETINSNKTVTTRKRHPQTELNGSEESGSKEAEDSHTATIVGSHRSKQPAKRFKTSAKVLSIASSVLAPAQGYSSSEVTDSEVNGCLSLSESEGEFVARAKVSKSRTKQSLSSKSSKKHKSRDKHRSREQERKKERKAKKDKKHKSSRDHKHSSSKSHKLKKSSKGEREKHLKKHKKSYYH